jgi:hypothetical protein
MGTGETRLRPSSETAREANPGGGLGATDPISGVPAKWARAERESERPILPKKRGNARGGKGPYLIGVSEGGKRG